MQKCQLKEAKLPHNCENHNLKMQIYYRKMQNNNKQKLNYPQKTQNYQKDVKITTKRVQMSNKDTNKSQNANSATKTG